MKQAMCGYGAMVLAAILTLAVVPNGISQNANIHLLITGMEETLFTGECVIVTRAGNEVVHALDGAVPSERAWQGDAVSCGISQASARGALEVVLTKDGNRTRSRTEGQNSVVRLNVR